MTNDKQIEAVAALEKWASDEVLPPQPSVRRGFIRGYQAAIAATHEQVKPLVEALEKIDVISQDPFEASDRWRNQINEYATEALVAIAEIQAIAERKE